MVTIAPSIGFVTLNQFISINSTLIYQESKAGDEEEEVTSVMMMMMMFSKHRSV